MDSFYKLKEIYTQVQFIEFESAKKSLSYPQNENEQQLLAILEPKDKFSKSSSDDQAKEKGRAHHPAPSACAALSCPPDTGTNGPARSC